MTTPPASPPPPPSSAALAAAVLAVCLSAAALLIALAGPGRQPLPAAVVELAAASPQMATTAALATDTPNTAAALDAAATAEDEAKLAAVTATLAAFFSARTVALAATATATPYHTALPFVMADGTRRAALAGTGAAAQTATETARPSPTATGRADHPLADHARAALAGFEAIYGSQFAANDHTVMMNAVMRPLGNHPEVVQVMAQRIEQSVGPVGFVFTLQGDDLLTEYVYSGGAWAIRQLPPLYTAFVPTTATATPYIIPTLPIAPPPTLRAPITGPPQTGPSQTGPSSPAQAGICPANCTEARARGLSPQQAAACGLDRDGDGQACYEQRP